MTEAAGPRTGGRILADAMLRNGVERAFCVPGESYLALLDALYDSPIHVTMARQEGGAAMMAEAWGKLTGRPGIVMATRGPGATNASAGLHIGRQDSTPMILLLGQVGRSMRGREAFQEMDAKHFFSEVAKHVEEIDSAARIPEIFSRAMHIATAGPSRSGRAVAAGRHAARDRHGRRRGAVGRGRNASRPRADCRASSDAVAAKKPFVILGGSRWSEAAVAGIRRFAEKFDLPVGCSLRRQMLFDHDHPNYAGDVGIGINPALAARVKEADTLVLIGGRMSEMPSAGYSLIDIPNPRQKLIHIYPGAEELGRVYRPALAINATPPAFVAALENLATAHRRDAVGVRKPAPRTRPIARGRRRKSIPGRCNSALSSFGSENIFPTTRSSRTAPATTPAGSIASSVFENSTRSSRRSPARWATACRQRSPQSFATRTAWSSLSPATGVLG